MAHEVRLKEENRQLREKLQAAQRETAKALEELAKARRQTPLDPPFARLPAKKVDKPEG